MKRIVYPLKLQMRSEAVADLQDSLLLFLEKGVLQLSDADREALTERLRRERADSTYGEVTHDLVGIFQDQHQLESTRAVDERTADSLNQLLAEHGALDSETLPCSLKGTIRLADGSPADGVTASAFDRDLRFDQLLGDYKTGRTGYYQIEYSSRQIRDRERGTADLVVKAFAADDSLLATSEVLFNAPLQADIDLVIPAETWPPPSLFERIGAALESLLGVLKVEELEEDKDHQDVSFLSGETGFEKGVLARFVLAHRLARQGIQAEFWFALLGGSLYQFTATQTLGDQLSTVLDALPSLNAATVRKSLARAFNQNEIPQVLREKSVAWVEAFLNLIARQSLSGTGTPTFVKAALEDAGIADAKKQEAFARLFNEHKALTTDLVRALENDTSFTKAEIADLRTSFELSDLTRSDFSVVKMLKAEFGLRQPEQIRMLARRE